MAHIFLLIICFPSGSQIHHSECSTAVMIYNLQNKDDLGSWKALILFWSNSKTQAYLWGRYLNYVSFGWFFKEWIRFIQSKNGMNFTFYITKRSINQKFANHKLYVYWGEICQVLDKKIHIIRRMANSSEEDGQIVKVPTHT